MFKALVDQKKEYARELYGSFRSLHEIYGVLCEEVAELFDEIRKKPDDRNPETMLSELVDIAAVVEIAAEDMQLVEETTEHAESKHAVLKEAITRFVNSMEHGSIRKLQDRQSCITSAFKFDEDALQKVRELIRD